MQLCEEKKKIIKVTRIIFHILCCHNGIISALNVAAFNCGDSTSQHKRGRSAVRQRLHSIGRASSSWPSVVFAATMTELFTVFVIGYHIYHLMHCFICSSLSFPRPFRAASIFRETAKIDRDSHVKGRTLIVGVVPIFGDRLHRFS